MAFTAHGHNYSHGHGRATFSHAPDHAQPQPEPSQEEAGRTSAASSWGWRPSWSFLEDVNKLFRQGKAFQSPQAFQFDSYSEAHGLNNPLERYGRYIIKEEGSTFTVYRQTVEEQEENCSRSCNKLTVIYKTMKGI